MYHTRVAWSRRGDGRLLRETEQSKEFWVRVCVSLFRVLFIRSFVFSIILGSLHWCWSITFDFDEMTDGVKMTSELTFLSERVQIERDVVGKLWQAGILSMKQNACLVLDQDAEGWRGFLSSWARRPDGYGKHMDAENRLVQRLLV